MDLETVHREATELEAMVEGLQVVDAKSHAEACRLEKDLDRHIAGIEEKFRPSVAKAYAAHKSAVALLNSVKSVPLYCRTALREKIGNFRLAEQLRIEEERRSAYAAAVASNKERGVSEDSLVVPIAVLPAETLDKHGVSTPNLWRCEVDNLPELIAWVAQDVPHRFHFLEAAQTVLNGHARTLKNDFNIPGCRAVSRFG